MQQRLAYFDNLKGVLILLVVVGHCLEKCDDRQWMHYIYTFIYTFHMPLFVMTTGYFCKDIAKFRDLFKRIIPYVYIYMLFQFIHILIDNDCKSIVSAILYPEYSLWYILSMIFWYIIDYYTPKTIKSNSWIIYVSIIISLVMGLVPLDKEFSFQRTFSFLPFFMAGKYCRSKSVHDFRFIGRVTASLIIASSIVCIILVPFDMSAFLYGQINLWRIAHHLYSSIAFKIIYYMLAFSISMSIVALIPEAKITWLTNIGCRTLYIYLYHTLILGITIKYIEINGPIGFVCLLAIETFALTVLYKISLTRDLIDVKKINTAINKITFQKANT